MVIRTGRDHVFRSFEGNVQDLLWPADVYLGKKIEEVVAIVRNVTHRRETEAQLEDYQWHLEHQAAARSADLSAAENRYRDIFRHSGAPSIIVDQDFTISMANPKFEELTGYRIEEIERRLMLMAASSDDNIILYGESGTGKELADRTIHAMSARQQGTFVPINCGAIPENLHRDVQRAGHRSRRYRVRFQPHPHQGLNRTTWLICPSRPPPGGAVGGQTLSDPGPGFPRKVRRKAAGTRWGR